MTRNDRLNDCTIAQMNKQEQARPASFYHDFIQSITVYEDEDIWVGDKPDGLLSVDGRTLKVSLQSRLLKTNPNIKLIHRLDMDTSGLIIFAKNTHAQTHISKQFISRLPQKEYQALAYGHLVCDDKQGMIDVPVRYEPTTKPRHIVDEHWHKHAITHYQVLRHEQRQAPDGSTHPITRLTLKPITGRSHQLRVHMAHIGHVIIGDPIYADGIALQLACRLSLHAHKLRLKHPTHEVWMEWSSKVPF